MACRALAPHGAGARHAAPRPRRFCATLRAAARCGGVCVFSLAGQTSSWLRRDANALRHAFRGRSTVFWRERWRTAPPRAGLRRSVRRGRRRSLVPPPCATGVRLFRRKRGSASSQRTVRACELTLCGRGQLHLRRFSMLSFLAASPAASSASAVRTSWHTAQPQAKAWRAFESVLSGSAPRARVGPTSRRLRRREIAARR